MLLMIDNYDSFTYNLVQYFAELGEQVSVFRNDKITLDEIAQIKPDRICLSPGPSNPNEAGICISLLKHFAGKLPILGVCLGHQAIAAAFGGQIVLAQKVMHGKTDVIHTNQQGLFAGLPQSFTVTRYHSLAVARKSLPDELIITAWTEDNEIMGLAHRDFPIHGVQFHPESILTEHGHALLNNFLQLK